MIRKLFAGVSVVAIAAVALLLMTVGTTSAKPAEATVANIGATVSSVGVNQFIHLQIDAQDDFWDSPNNSLWDLDVTASAGEFLALDPTGLFPGCVDQNGPFSGCAVNSNGFGQSNTFAPQGGPTPDGTVNTSTFTDTLSILNAFATGNTHFQVCNLHSGAAGDAWVSPDPAAFCNNNTSHIEAWWQAPPGILGTTVTFCATQTNTVCTNKTIVGPVASLELHALREDSTEASQCKGTDVFVIASADYSFNNPDVTFNNDRAVLCVEARDSNGTLVNAQNITWTTTAGALGSNATNTGGPPANVNNANNTLTSGGTAESGDVAHVVASIGSASDSVDIAFGGDPASCTMIIDPASLDIGDTAQAVVNVIDEAGNAVPDGIVVNFIEVDSGDGADNVELISLVDDTTNGEAGVGVIGAIAGDTVIAANVESVALTGDANCSDTISLSGDIHQTPGVCDDEDFILYGNQPPATGGFGTFAFCGGTYDQLLEASGCPEATSAFFYNTPAGDFIVWIPGSDVAAVNADFEDTFPPVHTPIPEGTIFTAKCV